MKSIITSHDEKKNNIIILSSSLIIYFIYVYILSRGGFYWDDPDNLYIIKTNSLYSNITSGKMWSNLHYRPGLIVVHYIELLLWGGNPAFFFLLNLTVHLLSSYLFYKIIKILTNDYSLSVLTLSLWLINPIATGTLVHISNLADIGSLFFSILTIYIFVLYLLKVKNRHLFLTILSSLLAYSFKESSYLLPVMLIGLNIYMKKNNMVENMKKMQLFYCFLAFVLFLSIRTIILGGNIGGYNEMHNKNFGKLFITPLFAVGKLYGNFLAFNLSLLIRNTPSTIVQSLPLILCLYIIIKKLRLKYNFLFLITTMIFISVIPTSPLYEWLKIKDSSPMRGFIRFQYFPSPWMALFIAYVLIKSLPVFTRTIISLIYLILFSFIGIIAAENFYRHSNNFNKIAIDAMELVNNHPYKKTNISGNEYFLSPSNKYIIYYPSRDLIHEHLKEIIFLKGVSISKKQPPKDPAENQFVLFYKKGKWMIKN